MSPALSELRAELEAGFTLPDLERPGAKRSWPWGTLAKAIAGLREPDPHSGRSVELPGMRWRDLDLLGVRVLSAGTQGPVESVDYLLGAEHGAHEAAGFDALRSRFVERLRMPGRYCDYPDHGGHPASRVRAAHEFDLEGVKLGLSSYGGIRDDAAGPHSGAIWIRASTRRLAEPFLSRFDAQEAAWSQGAGAKRVVQTLAVPGLRRVQTFHGDDADSRAVQALRHPERHAPPQWLRATLKPEQLVHWESGAHWGLACVDYTLVFEVGALPAFQHVRMLPARGRGAAYLTRAGLQGSNWSTEPGPDGLDAVVRYLETMGCPITSEEFADV